MTASTSGCRTGAECLYESLDWTARRNCATNCMLMMAMLARASMILGDTLASFVEPERTVRNLTSSCLPQKTTGDWEK